jgi:TPP-dependent pyruvate/acetoin dehydrogenase alpha subunit
MKGKEGTMADTQSVAEPDARERLATGYEMMVGIRRFEDRIQSLFMRGEVHGTIHLCNGHEATEVGVCSMLEDDFVCATYRGHGVALAVGVTPRALAAELMGRATGTNGGRSGSLNIIDRAHNLVHTSGIIGGSLGCALGASLSARKLGKVAVAFFGDGAANIGYFHECLNFARVYELPLLMVCENNLYGEFTPMASVTAGGDIAARAAAYDLASHKIDGNDLAEVQTVARDALTRIREGGGPEFIEALTYRQLGHSKNDPGAYRPKEEVAAWLKRDPLIIARRQLLDEGLSDDEVTAIEHRAETRVNEEIEAARQDPFPDPTADELTEYAA